MNRFYLPTASSPIIDWLIFVAVLLPVGLVIVGFVVWLTVFKAKNGKPRRRKLRHHRRTNPTLDQTGGLPAKRDPNQPPPGP